MYIEYKFPSNVPGCKDQWFYIGNYAPALPEKIEKPPTLRREWKESPNKSEMLQVNELLELIEALKLMGVAGASIMQSFFKRWIQHLQKRCRFGFNYFATQDPSNMCVEKLLANKALIRVKRVLRVPQLYSTQNQPLKVYIHCTRVLLL